MGGRTPGWLRTLGAGLLAGAMAVAAGVCVPAQAQPAPQARMAQPAPAPAPASEPVLAVERVWVSWVMDGDTLLVVRAAAGPRSAPQEPLKVRLLGLDAPEMCQAGGPAARDALVGWVHRQSVWLQRVGHDSYGRTLGRVWLQAGQGSDVLGADVLGADVAAQMVAHGWAWAWSHRTGRGPYAAQQKQAQAQRLGVFGAGPGPMSPALFRQFHGPCTDPKPN